MTIRCLAIAAILASATRSGAAPLYAGWTVGEQWNPTGPGAILRSTDSGNSWVRQGDGQIAPVTLSGVIALDPNTAWVAGRSDGTYATIYHTNDGGLIWTRKGSPADIPNADLSKIHATDENNVWAVGFGVILHTADGGHTWTNQTPAGYESTIFQGVFAVTHDTVWVTGGSTDGYATILKSTDAGMTWSRQSNGDVAVADHLLGISAVDADTAWTVGGTGNDYIALHTNDGGATWTRQPGVSGTWDANEIHAVDSSVVWAACDQGIFWTTDGGARWSSHAGVAFACMDVSAVNAQEAWAISTGYTHGFIYHTTDGGETWTEVGELAGETLPRLTNVSFSNQPIPEPSSVAILFLGVLVLRSLGRPARSRIRGMESGGRVY